MTNDDRQDLAYIAGQIEANAEYRQRRRDHYRVALADLRSVLAVEADRPTPDDAA